MLVPDSWNRYVAALAILLAPALVFVLPPLLVDSDFATAEEQLTAMANGPGSYGPLLVQAAGAVCLLLAVAGVFGVVARQRRGLAIAWFAVPVGLVGSTFILLALGMEFAVAFFLVESTEKAALIRLGLAINRWPLFGTFLAGGLTAFAVALPLVALALWRCGVVSILAALTFLLPLVLGLLPLESEVANLAVPLSLLVPCAWLSIGLLRGQPRDAPRSDGELSASA